MTQHDASGEVPAPVAEPLRLDDPWYAELASGRGERHQGDTERQLGSVAAGGADTDAVEASGGLRVGVPVYDEKAAIYLAVQRGDAFQEVRRSHRRFVFPATVAFLAWYLLYIVTVTAAPEAMARPVGEGPFNVGMLAGLGQFLTTGLLTWAYVRHARTRRDRAAFELRWETQLRTRGASR